MPLMISRFPYLRVRRRETTEGPWFERIRCRVDNWPSIGLDVDPGGNFPTTFTVEGTTYSWTNANDPLTVIDKTVQPVPDPSCSCPSCGATRFLDGQRGTGQ